MWSYKPLNLPSGRDQVGQFVTRNFSSTMTYDLNSAKEPSHG